MQQLKYLEVTKCQMLQVIEIDAPKLSTFIYGDVGVKISLGDPLQVKDIRLMGYNEADTVCYARTKLPSILPNIESLVVSSPNEVCIIVFFVPSSCFITTINYMLVICMSHVHMKHD
jgi:hypothetical protein